MANDDRRRPRPERERRMTLHEAVTRLGHHGAELRESLAWCEERGMEGLAQFYLEEIEYLARRLPRPRSTLREEEERA